MDLFGTAIGVSLGLLFWFLVILALRRMVWWYWGIDRFLKAQEDIALSLRFLPGREKHDLAKRIQRHKAA